MIPGFKMVEREGRLRLWVKRGDLIVVYVIPDVASFWRSKTAGSSASKETRHTQYPGAEFVPEAVSWPIMCVTRIESITRLSARGKRDQVLIAWGRC
jgi:hypothetical protein